MPLPTGPGQESVWDYPRPPRVEPDDREVVVVLGGVEVCRTRRGLKVLETSHPPAWYLPREDWRPDALEPAPGTSSCEWKGVASWFTVVGGGRRAEGAAWSYPDPVSDYASLRGAIAVYPAAVDRCTVGGELVRPQEGGFYGGWITDEVVGPFKGVPGSRGW